MCLFPLLACEARTNHLPSFTLQWSEPAMLWVLSKCLPGAQKAHSHFNANVCRGFATGPSLSDCLEVEMGGDPGLYLKILT